MIYIIALYASVTACKLKNSCEKDSKLASFISVTMSHHPWHFRSFHWYAYMHLHTGNLINNGYILCIHKKSNRKYIICCIVLDKNWICRFLKHIPVKDTFLLLLIIINIVHFSNTRSYFSIEMVQIFFKLHKKKKKLFNLLTLCRYPIYWFDADIQLLKQIFKKAIFFFLEHIK